MSIETSLHRREHIVCDDVIATLAADEAALRERVRDLEAEAVAYRDLYMLALTEVAQRDRRIRHLEDDIRFLRSQIRAAVSGRTIAEERQTLDRELLDAENGHDSAEADDEGDRGRRHDARRAA